MDLEWAYGELSAKSYWDVWVDEADRGTGVGSFLMEGILADPRLARVRKWLLFTEDAQGFYGALGFRPTASPEGYMELKPEAFVGPGETR